MKTYVRSMQDRLRERKFGAKKQCLREIVKEVGGRDKTIRLTYKLPMAPRTSLPRPLPAKRRTLKHAALSVTCHRQNLAVGELEIDPGLQCQC
jgi:hypothetical protein